MGKDKPSVSEGLRFLVEKKVQVEAVVALPKDKTSFSGEKLFDVAKNLGLNVITEEQLYNYISTDSKQNVPINLENIDLVISFLFWKIIKKPLIELPKIGCINLHPAPLSEYRGFSPYSLAIYQNSPFWGVSAHFVDETIDTGDIIKVNKFQIDPKKETAYSLEQQSQKHLLNLFKEVIEIATKTNSLPRQKQTQGNYFSKKDFEKLRRITANDSLDEIERKTRAFWYPPYDGAYIEINGQEYTILTKELLKEIGEQYHKKVNN